MLASLPLPQKPLKFYNNVRTSKFYTGYRNRVCKNFAGIIKQVLADYLLKQKSLRLPAAIEAALKIAPLAEKTSAI
jgi:hypothetical protein